MRKTLMSVLACAVLCGARGCCRRPDADRDDEPAGSHGPIPQAPGPQGPQAGEAQGVPAQPAPEARPRGDHQPLVELQAGARHPQAAAPDAWSRTHPVGAREAARIARCESHNNPRAVSASGATAASTSSRSAPGQPPVVMVTPPPRRRGSRTAAPRSPCVAGAPASGRSAATPLHHVVTARPPASMRRRARRRAPSSGSRPCCIANRLAVARLDASIFA